tara:strand:- start:571 stop:954 length:384 start_codon:yes stop_codon:yes gene_type:complete
MSLLDNIDISILAFVADHPDSTVTDCAKIIFEPKNTDELQKKDSFLRHRFKALVSTNFLIYDSDSNKKMFRVVKERVFFGPELRGIDIGGKKIVHSALRKDYCIILLTDDGVIVKSLDKIEEQLHQE